jgi:pseudolysin/vibriolysin
MGARVTLMNQESHMKELLSKRLCCAVVSLLGGSSVSAATKLHVEQGEARSFAPMQVSALAGSLGLETGSQLSVKREAPTAHGTRIVRMQQGWHGVPVFGADVTVETGSDDAVLTMRGDVFVGLATDLSMAQPRLSEADVRALWRKETGATPDNSEDRDATLYVYAEDGTRARLVYLLSHFMGGSRPTAIIDADTGEILQRWNGLTSAQVAGPGGNEKTGRYTYGVDRPALQVRQDGAYCTTDTPDVKTYHAHNTGTFGSISTPPQPKEWRFPCSNSTGDAVNGA